jgi:hypothetical protein
VKNGDRFVVAATKPDGSMAVRRVSGGAEVDAAGRLRRPARRARLRHDQLPQPRPHRRHDALAGLADHDPRGALRRRHARARVKHDVRRHELRPGSRHWT